MHSRLERLKKSLKSICVFRGKIYPPDTAEPVQMYRKRELIYLAVDAEGITRCK